VGTPLYPNFAHIPGGSTAVPGLGFDYDHVVAVDHTHVNRGSGVRRAGFITPFFFAGDLPFYGYGDTDYDNPEPVQRGVIVPPPGLQSGEPAPAQAVSSPAVAAVAPESAVKDVGDFILVRRDGQVTLAVAFTASGDRLTYVTREGIRRSFPLAELDSMATRQMNDANGTTLSLP